jgi:hypothetical protein
VGARQQSKPITKVVVTKSDYVFLLALMGLHFRGWTMPLSFDHYGFTTFDTTLHYST